MSHTICTSFIVIDKIMIIQITNYEKKKKLTRLWSQCSDNRLINSAGLRFLQTSIFGVDNNNILFKKKKVCLCMNASRALYRYVYFGVCVTACKFKYDGISLHGWQRTQASLRMGCCGCTFKTHIIIKFSNIATFVNP